MDKIKVALSSCLSGESVRYNGGHKRSKFCMEKLVDYFDFQPLCPEVGIGMSVPREPIRLVGDFGSPRVQGVKTPELDVTESLRSYADTVSAQLGHCSGYILMKDSPSCGLYSTKVYTEKGVHLKKRSGVYTAAVQKNLPLMPMEEAGRLNDSALRENFITRVFLYHDWQSSVAQDLSAKALVAFHSRHKYLAMAYSQNLYRELGRMIAQAGCGNLNELASRYIERFMQGSASPPSRKGHVNVLYHLIGYLKSSVPGNIRQDLTKSVEQYRFAHVPLAVPLALLNHYLEHYGTGYVNEQSYLQPHPAPLGLRNAI